MEYTPNGSEHESFFGTAPGLCPKCGGEVMFVRGGRSGMFLKNKCGFALEPGEAYVNCPTCGIFYEQVAKLQFS